jgi:hypothetical protein
LTAPSTRSALGVHGDRHTECRGSLQSLGVEVDGHQPCAGRRRELDAERVEATDAEDHDRVGGAEAASGPDGPVGGERGVGQRRCLGRVETVQRQEVPFGR